MTEAKWLASADPAAMLEFLTGSSFGPLGLAREEARIPKPGDRKLRLFACDCVRQEWSRLDDERRQAVCIAELFVDFEADRDRMFQMHTQAFRVPGSERPGPQMAAAECCHPSATEAARQAARLPVSTPEAKADLLRDIVGNPFRVVNLPDGPPVMCEACDGSGEVFDESIPVVWGCHGCGGTGHRSGKGFVPGPCPWLTPSVRTLAEAVYAGRSETTGHLDPLGLWALADALEEAGCEDPHCTHCVGGVWGEYEAGEAIPCHCVHHRILAHLRSPGPHVRGCHIVDLILGKE